MSKEKKGVIIKDKIIHPYYLSVDENQFSVYKEIPSGHQTQAKGYFSSLDRALNSIIHSKTLNECKNEEIIQLQTYIDTYMRVSKSIKDAFKHIKVM